MGDAREGASMNTRMQPWDRRRPAGWDGSVSLPSLGGRLGGETPPSQPARTPAVLPLKNGQHYVSL